MTRSRKPDISVIVQSAAWKTRLRSHKKIVCAAVEAALLYSSPRSGEGVITVVLADDAFIKELNYTYRGKNKATNVLAFPSGEFLPPLRGEVRRGGEACSTEQVSPPTQPSPSRGEGLYLGDIVLALETIEAEAAAQKKSLKDHVTHLVVHGVLHLLGHDHEEEAEAEEMERREIKILAKLGVKNPYL